MRLDRSETHGRAIWRAVLLNAPFLTTTSVGIGLTGVFSFVGESTAQTTYLGVLLSVAMGLIAASVDLDDLRERNLLAVLERLGAPVSLMNNGRLLPYHASFAKSLTRLSQHPDGVLRDLAELRLSAISTELSQLANGQVSFRGTEAWRSVYEQLLSDIETRVYYSVAWVTSLAYWNDIPGRHSIRFNYELINRGFRIERALILPDSIWPYDEPLPVTQIHAWIDEQHANGIQLYLLREHELQSEPELLDDFGIYGRRATGQLRVDEHGRTVHFTFDFSPEATQLAMSRWERLLLYATPYSELLDRAH